MCCRRVVLRTRTGRRDRCTSQRTARPAHHHVQGERPPTDAKCGKKDPSAQPESRLSVRSCWTPTRIRVWPHVCGRFVWAVCCRRVVLRTRTGRRDRCTSQRTARPAHHHVQGERPPTDAKCGKKDPSAQPESRLSVRSCWTPTRIRVWPHVYGRFVWAVCCRRVVLRTRTGRRDRCTSQRTARPAHHHVQGERPPTDAKCGKKDPSAQPESRLSVRSCWTPTRIRVWPHVCGRFVWAVCCRRVVLRTRTGRRDRCTSQRTARPAHHHVQGGRPPPAR